MRQKVAKRVAEKPTNDGEKRARLLSKEFDNRCQRK